MIRFSKDYFKLQFDDHLLRQIYPEKEARFAFRAGIEKENPKWFRRVAKESTLYATLKEANESYPDHFYIAEMCDMSF